MRCCYYSFIKRACRKFVSTPLKTYSFITTRACRKFVFTPLLISLKFIAIVDYGSCYSILSAYHFVMFYVHCSMFICCSIIKASCDESRFTVDTHLAKFRSCSLYLIFTVAFRRRVFYISHLDENICRE